MKFDQGDIDNLNKNRKAKERATKFFRNRMEKTLAVSEIVNGQKSLSSHFGVVVCLIEDDSKCFMMELYEAERIREVQDDPLLLCTPSRPTGGLLKSHMNSSIE